MQIIFCGWPEGVTSKQIQKVRNGAKSVAHQFEKTIKGLYSAIDNGPRFAISKKVKCFYEEIAEEANKDATVEAREILRQLGYSPKTLFNFQVQIDWELKSE